MYIMKGLFIPYELAVKLKEKGFNEECLRCYSNGELQSFMDFRTIAFTSGIVLNENLSGGLVSAPLWQQVEEWLYSVHKMHLKLFGWEETGFDCYLFKNDSFIGHSVKCKSVTEAKKKAIEKLVELL